MKKLLKRWLAMVLAALMVMGTLPTSAFAARITDDVVGENPVLDQNDPVADTQGRYDDSEQGEKPVDPIDPDGPPADQMAVQITQVTAGGSISLGTDAILATGTPSAIPTTMDGNLAVVVVPWFKARATGQPVAANIDFNGDFANNVTLDATGSNGVEQKYFGPIYAARIDSMPSTDVTKIEVNGKGQILVNGTVKTASQTVGNALNTEALIAWAQTYKDTGLYDGNNEHFNPVTDGYLPYRVFIGGTAGYEKADIRIPISAQPLKVEIVPTEQISLTALPADGWQYGVVNVTNNTRKDMNGVTVTLNRGNLVFQDAQIDGWATTPVDTDAGTTNIISPDEPEYAAFVVGNVYGFDDENATDTRGKIVINIPAGETIPLPVTAAADVCDAINFADIGDMLYDGACDQWANYTAVATYGDATDSDDAGIHWVQDAQRKPKVRLVDIEGNPIDVVGDGVRNNTAAGKVKHKVSVGELDLVYYEAEGYYAPADLNTTVAIPGNIYVDEVAILDKRILSNDVVDVIMYKLEVIDGRTGKTEDHLGSFIGETPTNVTNRNAVKYSYYAPKSVVRVWANSAGFSHWTNATVHNDFAGKQDGEEIGRLTLNGDTTVTANYLPPITLVTTLGGDNADYLANPNDRSIAHVHSIRVINQADKTVAASAIQQTNGSYTLTNMTAQTTTAPWSFTVGKGTYTLEINGFEVETIDTNDLPATTPMYVEELAGVKPVVTGAQETEVGFSMLPDDLNPNRSRGTLDIDKDSAATVLYYPMGATIQPYVSDGTYDRLDTLTYPAGTDKKPASYVGDGTDRLSLVIVRGTEQVLEAVYGQSLELWMYLDGTQYTTKMATNIVLKPVGAADDSGNIAVTQSTDYGYIYTSNTALAAGTTYEIWVNGFDTGLKSTSDKSTATLGEGEDAVAHTYIPVPMQAVTVGDQSGITTTTASSFTGGRYTGATSGNIPSGCTIAVTHGAANNYAANGWTFAKGTATTEKGNFTYTASATTGEDSQGAQTLTAQYVASTGKATVNIYVDGDPSDVPVTTADGGVDLYKGTSKVADLTKDDTGVYSANVAPDTYNVYINGNDTGVEITVTTAGESADVKYWTVSVSTDGNGKATVTANTNTALAVDGKTSAEATNATAASIVVIEGTKVTWAFGDPNTYYEEDKWDGGANHNNIVVNSVDTDTVKTQNALFKQKKADVTVTVKLNGTAGGVGKAVKVTVNGEEKTVAADANADAAVLTFNVPEQAEGYTVTVADSPNGWSTTQVYAPSGENRPANADVNFYELTLDSDDHGFVDFATTAPTANGATLTQVGLSGTEVNIAAGPATNYKFENWTGGTTANFGTGETTAVQTYTITKQETLTANFTKPYYDTYLVLRLNKDAVTGTGDDHKTPSDADITKVELVQTKDGTTTRTDAHYDASANGSAGAWTVNAEFAKGTGVWTITTTTGPYTATSNGDSTTPAEKDLYSVKVVRDNTGNGAAGSEGATAPKINTNKDRVILEAGGTATLASNGKDGFTYSKWVVVSNLGSEEEANPETEADIPTGAKYGVTGTGATQTLSLTGGENGYAANAELVLRPKFTYWVQIQVKDSSGNALGGYAPSAGGKTGAQVGSTTGLYKISGLDPDGGDQTVSANGFDSNVKIGTDKAGNTVDLIMYQVKVAKQTAESGETIDGHAYIAKGETATSGSSVYLPQGAKTDDTHKVTVAATTGTKYRLKTNSGEKPWTADTYVTAQGNATTTVKTPDDGLGEDITITADFVRQYTATSEVTGITSPQSKATIDGNTATSKTVDKNTIVAVTFTKALGEKLTGWSCEHGTLYSDNAGTTALPTGSTTTTVYFKPTGDGAKVTATVATGTYPVKVIVRKDGAALTTGITVKLGGTDLSYDSDLKAWTYAAGFEPNSDPGYALTTNVSGGGGTAAQAATGKTMKFTSQDGEKALGTTGATGDASKLTLEVNYWTVTLAAVDHGKEAFATTAPSADAAAGDRAKIVLDGGSVSVAANPDTNYKFTGWTSSNDDTAKGAFAAAANAVTSYQTIKATATLTPSFEQKKGAIKVTVKVDNEKDDQSATDPVDANDLHTVTLYQVGTGADGADAEIGTAKKGNSGEYTFIDVPYNQGEAKYYVTVVKKDAATGAQTFTSAKNIEFSGNDGATKEVIAPYFTLKVHTTQTITGSTALAGRVDQALSSLASTTVTKTDTGAIAYVAGTKVYIKADKADARYDFDGWEVTSGASPTTPGKTGAATDVTLANTLTGPTVLLAKFQKTQFNAYLDVKVNNIAHTDPDVKTDIKKVELVKSKTDGTPWGTVSYTGGHWTAGPLNSTTVTAGQWKITTVDDAVYYEPMKTNEQPSEKLFYGVTVLDGDHGNNTNHAYVRADGTTRAVAPIGENVAIKANPDPGYTFSKWLADHAGTPTADLDADAEKVTALSDGNFKFNTGYTTTDGKDIYLKPVYTYEVTVRTVRPNATTPTQMDPTDPNGNVVVNGNTIAPTSTGVYKVIGLTPGDTEYVIKVNGFDSSVKIKEENANGTVDVELFSVTVEKKDRKDTTLTPDGSVAVNLGASASGSAASVYLPVGAKTTAGETDVTKVNLTAAVGTTNPKFRLWDKDDTTTTGRDETLWNVETITGVPDGKKMTATIATTTGTGALTPNNLTIGGADGMQADVTVTAYFLRQYDLTVSAVKEDKTTPATSKVNVTEKQGLGTSALPVNAAQSVTMSKVDEQTYVKVDFTKAVGETFIGWDFTADDGKLYTALKDGAVDPATEVAPAAAATNTTTTVYFVPAKDGAALKAVVKAATYNVKVTVNLDNAAYKDANLKVELRGSDGKTIALSDEDGDGNQTGVFTIPESVVTKASPEVTYKIYVNGVDLDATLGNNDYTEKDIKFTAKQAEGIMPNDTPAATDEDKAALQANLEKTINYYTVNLKADPEGTDPTQNKISFAAITGSNTGKTTDSKIFLAKAAGYGINIYSKVYAGRGTTDTVHYRFVDWTETATTHGFDDKDADNTAYKFPKEETLVADTTNIDGTKDGKQLTLTANFKEQYKVTVKRGYNESSSVTPQVMVTGDTAADKWKTTVYVDEGGTVDLQTSGSISGLHFQSWTIAKKAAPNETEDDGKGKFQNEDDATKYEAERGTKKASADNATNPNNLNGFKPEDDTVIDLNLWKEPDLTDGLWSYQRGVGKENNDLTKVKKFTWTVNDAKEITKVNVKAFNDGNTYNKDLTAGVDYNLVDGKIVLTDAYIDSQTLPKGDYDITVTYTLGTTYNEVEKLTKATKFYILQDPYKLTRVDIGVPTKTVAEDYTRQPDKTLTMNIDATDNKTPQAAYLESDDSHLHKSISKDDLTFTWFWAAKAPTQGTMTGTTLTNYNAGTLPTGWHKITDTDDFTATFTKNAEGNYTAVPTFTSNGTDYTDLKGNYVFAVVTATTTGEGTVITNAIPVDYDASVKVQQNGTGIAAANKDDYCVYFVPSTVTPAQTDFATPAAMTAKGIVQAAYNTTLHDGTYETSNSALDPNKNYNVYVNDAQGVYTAIVNSGAKTITRLDKDDRVVDFYTVTPKDFTWHEFKTNSGETTSEVKIGSLTTANNTAIDLANKKYGVLKGSNVKALANGTNWTQDYNLSWQAVEGAAFNTNSPYDVVAANKTKTDATTNGYTWNTVGAATIIGGRLIQNTYTLTGVIRDVNGATGGESGELNTATLTIKNGENTITYTGTVGNSGREKGTVSFTVPKGTYTLTSTVKTGSTHKGYYKGNDTSAKPAEATPKHVPDTPQDELKLDELTAGTNGATVSGRFTIYVVKTALTLNLTDQDGHTTNNISGTNKATATHTVKTDEEAKIVFNYDAFPETVTVKNMGNTPLKLTATLQSKALTDADTAFTSVTLTDGEDGKGTTFVYTKKIAADGTETTETTNLVTGNDGAFVLQPGEAREVTITIPDSLKNKDDLTYRLTFDAKDGRDGTTQGPVVGYNLNIDIDPVTVYHVGTKQNDDGSYTAQYTWITEDSTDITNTANANGQSYQKLEKPVTTDADRAPDSTNDDLIYSWYVASWDAVVSLDTNGNPTGGDVALGQGAVSTNGLTYTPKDTEYGKALYLVVKGQNNATGAAMTPDRTKDEEPVPVPYAGKVEIWHNDTKQPATGNDAPEGYAVYLWDKNNTGDFNLNDAIATTWDSTGNYFATKITDLWPGENYAVYTNIVRGQTTKASDFAALTGVNIDETHQDVVKAVYRQVKVANTKVTQSGYDTDLGTVESAKSKYFFQTADGATVKATPAEKPSAGVAGFDDVDVANDWVRTGTTVTFTYPKWTRDYNLSWTGGVTATGNNADKPNTENISHTATYSSQLDEVKTSLDLNLYNVSAHVVGSVGYVGWIDMTLTDKVGEDAGKTYTFVTKSSVAGKIFATAKDWTDNIKVAETAVFRLPKADGYVVSGNNDRDSAADFAGYTYDGVDYDYVKGEGATPEQNATIPVNVKGATSYDVRLKGEGLAMRVKGDVPASLNNRYVPGEDTPQSSAGQATILPTGTDRAPAGTAASDIFHLNYNYNEDLTVVVTASNESRQGADEAKCTLYGVTFAAGSYDSNKFAVTNNKFDPAKNLSRTGTGTDEDPYKPQSDTVTIQVKKGLPVGTHTFTGTFTFKESEAADAEDNTVTYTLTVIVEPLEFTAVSIDEKAGVSNGTLTITDYTVTRKAEAGDPATPTLTTKDTPAATATDADEKTALKQTPDYGYQWIRTAPGVTVPNVASVSASGALTSSGTANYTEISGATGKEYTPVTADEGQNLYLVIYGTDDAAGTRHNATGFAVSPAQVNTYQGIVYINVDGGRIGVGAADNTDPGYTVEFIANDEAQTKTGSKWEVVEGGNYGYVSETGLTPGLEYTVKVSRAKDDNTTVALTKKLTGTKIGKTITLTGTTDPDNFTNVTQADYFTVTAVKLTAKAFNASPSTGEDFDYVGGTNNKSKDHTDILPEVYINEEKLTSGTPVLKGQSVAAKIPSAWTQDYTLTWQMDNAAGADDTFVAANDTAYVQKAAEAIVDAAYPHGTVNAKTYIGGRLDQNTYDIVGHVKGKTTPQKNQVVNVTLMGSTVLYYSDNAGTIPPTAAIRQNKWAEPLGVDGYHNTGDTITFTVVAGTYDVTAYEGEGYTIRSVTIPTAADATPAGTPGATRNTNKFNTDVKGLDADARHFWINLEPAGPQLKVTDTETSAHTATSGTGEADHKFADNNDGAHYYYKQLTADDVFTLELSNPGNVDLKLKAPEVYKLDTGTDYSNMQTALSGKTALTNLTVKDGTRTILTFAGLPVANDDVLVGESVSHDGNTLTNAGTITVSKDVYNKDDAIYVVKFASEYLTTDGAPAVSGPTVYYVLDLKVEPLPIKKVTAETDPTQNDGTLRLKDFVATGGNANDGLNSVEVDHDRNAETALKGAKDAGLIDADISYVWYSAPTTATVVAGDFEFDTTGMKLTAQGTAKGLKRGTGTTGDNGKTYKPSDAEQGLNFYLVAYRTDADKNASEFAVSDGVYAQVTIAMKAYRTGETNKVEANELPTATVFISHGADDDMVKSNDGTVTVTGIADNANVLTFNATKTDVTAQDKADDPAAAKWYFKSWAVKPLTGDELDATDTSIETPVAGERLTMNYTATGKATVIGYFDKLPELSYKNGALAGGYVIGNDADEVENDRTLTYTHNDGSGSRKVRVFIAPANDGKSVFGGTWASKTSEELTFGYFDKVAGVATGSSTELGVDGDYVLSREQLIKPYLKSGSTYVITFYDMEKGAKAENGYEGYDRSVTLTITAGNFDVTARAKDANKTQDGNQGGVVRLYTTKPTDDTGFKKEDKKTTSGGFIQAEAKAEPGYKFVGWKVLTHDDDDAVGNGGTMTPANGKSLVVSFSPDGEGAILEASFEKAPFTPQADAKTSVYYGDDALQETDGKLVVSVTKDTDTTVTQNFSYALANEAELTAYLNGVARPANAYTTDGVPGGDGNPNTNVVPAWLDCAVDATDNTKVNFTVKANTPATGVNVQKTADGEDVEDELVVYLKVTETHTGESKIVPVTIDVKTSKLEIATAGTAAEAGGTLGDKTQPVFDGDAYLALFEALTTATYPGEGRKPDHEEKVYYDYFAYTNVHNKFNPTGNIVDANDRTGVHAANAAGANRWDKTAGAANTDYGKVTDGYWTVASAAFDGTGPNGYVAGEEKTNAHDYVFTFHYTGAETAEDDYNYENATITLTIPALVPEMSLKFADTLHTTTQGGDPKTLLTLTKGTHSGEVVDDGYVKNDATDHAPISLAYANEADRTDEHLTYLDEEPVFHVTLQKIGNLKRVELTATDVDGFETELPTFTIDPNETTQTASFDVKLTHMKDNAKLWVGDHTITITAKGYYDDATGAEKFITATYELKIVIDPRLITAVDVTTEYDKTEPTDVTPTIEGNPTLNDKGEDAKGNTPIKDATVTWETMDEKNPVPVKETVKLEIDPNYQIVPDDIKPETELNGKNDKETLGGAGKNPDPNTVVTPEEPAADKTDGGKITITQLHPILMFNDQKEGDDSSKAGPVVNLVRHLNSVKVGSNAADLGKVLIDLGAYSSDVYDVDVEVKVNDFAANGGVLTPELPEGQLSWPQIDMIEKDGKTHYVMDLTGLDTSKAMDYVLRLEAKGTEKDGGAQTIPATYELHLRVTPNSPPPSGGGEVCPCKVFYHVGLHGTTTDATIEDVSESNRPSKVPAVTPLDGYVFRGWSQTNPATLKKGEKITLVDPKTVTAKGDAMTFYAVIVERPFHEHYVIGYPNGNFGPADNIDRASVATIIARAILPDFKEGSNYGNPGGYSDVSGHWAESAIAYCSKFGVFEGYTDGTFKPNQPITRQEFALVIARLDGVMTPGEMDFTDIDEAGAWALGGIYTAYAKGWVNGYTDGTFKPLNNIRRDEAVKVFNAYLNRGVDADGLRKLHEYVHSGVASNVTGNGTDEYMTWPDVPQGHWAYYEIVEAANDHEYVMDFESELGYTLPEEWDKCWIDERWRYHDDLTDGGPNAALLSAGFRVWLH